MEVLDGMMLKSSTCSYTHLRKPYETSKSSSFSSSNVCFRRGNQIPSLGNFGLKAGNGGFDDKGHLEYYSRGSTVCGEKKGKGKKGWNGIPTKKKMKLLKGLVEDLSTFSDLGYGLELGCDDNNQGFVADNKSSSISQAAETLLAQLKQLRAEEEAQMKNSKSQDCESSSSSESSDNECDEVIDMKCIKNKTIVQPSVTPEILPGDEQLSPKILEEQSVTVSEQLPQSSEQKCCNMILDMTLNKEAGIEVLDTKTPNIYQSGVGSTGKKIEVCMGGKCKKSGSPALMEEFQRVMGDEGVVEGCKCMGKCKTAPNVKVSNGNAGDVSLKAPGNSVCIGVGLEDVELIVANYLGEGSSKDQLNVAVAAV